MILKYSLQISEFENVGFLTKGSRIKTNKHFSMLVWSEVSEGKIEAVGQYIFRLGEKYLKGS